MTAGHRWTRGLRGRTHTRAIDGAPVRKIAASVYRSEARANQTDIIDLTCDLEIRKITDGERLEPIIIVNIGRPSSHSFTTATAAATAAVQASYVSKVRRPYSQQLRPLPSSLPPLPWSLFLYICVFLFSLHPSLLIPLLYPSLLFPSSGISRRYVGCSVSRAFIYINFAGFLLFGGFGASMKRRKYKIIMIIMSHFARNNTVGGRDMPWKPRAIRRANNAGRQGSTLSRRIVLLT